MGREDAWALPEGRRSCQCLVDNQLVHFRRCFRRLSSTSRLLACQVVQRDAVGSEDAAVVVELVGVDLFIGDDADVLGSSEVDCKQYDPWLTRRLCLSTSPG